MTEPATAQRIKDQQTKHWNSVAAGWAEWLAWTERNFRPVTDWFVEAGWAPGARVLDVACGAGYPALAAAARVQPGGAVVACDISPEMTGVASAACAAAGLNNIELRTMDAEQLQFDDGSFDMVMNAYGLMFCPDPVRAIREAHRVLKPGGRLAIVTWDELSKSPFFDVVTAVGAKYLSLVAPQPGAPGPFRFSSPQELESLLRAAGFVDVQVESRPMVVEFDSAEQYCQIFSDLAWKARIASLPDAQLKAFRDDVSRAVEPYIDGGRLRLVATSLCTAGRKV